MLSSISCTCDVNLLESGVFMSHYRQGDQLGQFAKGEGLPGFSTKMGRDRANQDKLVISILGEA